MYSFPETIGSHILYAEAGSTQGLCNRVANGLTAMANARDYTHLYFMGDSGTPWLCRPHTYPPVTRALEYLMENGISETFNGVIKVDLTELPQFVKHLFWLVRCNGVTFAPHFTDESFNIIGNICQYGNIHISTLTTVADDGFNDVVLAAGLNFLEGMDCGASRINGRHFA
ncbi:hypothetical protein [Mucilaginibacter pedocola]|uniref:Uncharacterized protein n=1 Tax=Mucilaginibacter pedocola TaxID=1792845 RepID=A0A1S9P9J9_9SPHI|nr:hypothetical protein [Mucilaginibacter pedocola]OOQ57589.1 hypothetical protein BC343_12335 [Mucilaginibacter pedocola]